MRNISIITQHDLVAVNGSTVRPKWQIKALEKTGYSNVKIVDKFSKSKLNQVTNSFIHAHQLSGRLLENEKYFVDIHGLEHIQSRNLSGGYSFTS